MIVRWAPQALADRQAVWEYIAEDNPAAAVRMDEAFGDAASRLAEYPDLGKPGVVPGTRELFPVDRYRLVYEIKDTEVWILALVHTARLWPPAEGQ